MWISVGGLGLAGLWGFVFTAVDMKYKAWFAAHDVAAGLWVVISLVLFAIGVGCVARMIFKKHGLVCTSCKHWIGSQPLMLKTGRCPKCQNEMFHDA